MLKADTTALVLIDVQEKLARVMHEREELIENLVRLVRGAQALDVPIVWVEQNPKGLGPTVNELASLMPGREPVTKMTFSCCGTPAFMETFRETGRSQVLVAGIESHVCVYQTAAELVEAGHYVEVVADCVSSRTSGNKQIALQKMRECGVRTTSVEMALFELLGAAEGERFKAILKIVK